MNIVDVKRILAIKAVELIKEYESRISWIRESFITDVFLNEEDMKIVIKDKMGDHSYSVSTISKYNNAYMNWKFNDKFEALKCDNFNEEYNDMEESEFKEYVGRVYYTEHRCREICEELDSIEERYIALDGI